MRGKLIDSFNKLIPKLVCQHGVTLHIGSRYFFLQVLIVLDFGVDLETELALSDLSIIRQTLENIDRPSVHVLRVVVDCRLVRIGCVVSVVRTG